MPIVEKDPWRMQYFEGVECPQEVVIPTDDELAWQLYPQYRWVYDKIQVCDTQGIEHAPHGIAPRRFPVFSKPITNLRGMGTGARIIETLKEFEREQRPGHMWMELLEGDHVSSDAVVVRGEPAWWRHTMGLQLGGGMFNYWTVLAEARPEIESYGGEWIRRHLSDYTGALNIETIGGRIIEAHLRFADQWVDLYGPGWIEAIVELYATGRWSFREEGRVDGYSVVLFGGHGVRHEADRTVVEEILCRPGISSVQITFHPGRTLRSHAMPPGGFRLAIVNCWDLDAGIEARRRLAEMFAANAAARRKPKP